MLYILLIHCLFTPVCVCAKNVCFWASSQHTYVHCAPLIYCRTYALCHEVFRFKFQHVFPIEMFSIFRTFSLFFFSFIFLFSIFVSLPIQLYAKYTICICAFYAIALLLYITLIHFTMWSQWKWNEVGYKIEVRKLCLL